MLKPNKRLSVSNFDLRRFIFVVVLFSVLNFSFFVAAAESSDEDNSAQPTSFAQYWEDYFFLKADLLFYGNYKLVNSNPMPVEKLASINAALGYEPNDYLSLRLNVAGVLPLNFSLENLAAYSNYAFNPYLRVGDSYLKINAKTFSVWMGYLIIPWSNNNGSMILNRLNPVDYRPGLNFSAMSQALQPQWGLYFQTSAFKFNLDLVFLAQYSPSKGSLVAANQGNVQIAHYQNAFLRNAGSWEELAYFNRSELWSTAELISPALALRLRRPVSDTVDVGVEAFWGFNEVPSLNLPASVAGAFGKAYFDDSAVLSNACDYYNADIFSQCLGGQGALSYQRYAGFGFDVRANLGAVVLKGEHLAEPRLGEWGGKTTVLVSRENMRTAQLPFMAASFAVDAEYGDLFSGSLELIDSIWFDVPAGEYVLGVESLKANVDTKRNLHRLAIAVVFNSAFFDQWLLFNLKGELGLTQPDILAHVSFSHVWDKIGLETGLYSDVFWGIAGSPGWFRSGATSLGVFLQKNID